MANSWIVRASAEAVALQFGQEGEVARATTVSTETGEPIAGVPVRFEVLRGDLRLTGAAEGDVVVIDSDEAGDAVVRGVLHGKEPALLLARQATDKAGTDGEPDLLFRVRGPGVIDALSVTTETVVDADSGSVTVDIYGLDAWGDDCELVDLRVNGSLDNIAVQADGGLLGAVQGDVARVGPGHWHTKLQIREAGCWTVSAQDRRSGEVAATCLRVVPGKPVAIKQVDSADPRAEPPYDRTVLRLQMLDRFGNSMPSATLRASIDGRDVAFQRIDDEIWIPVRAVGQQNLTVDVRDEEADLAAAFDIQFSGYWMILPSLVEPEERARIEIRAQPAPGRAVDKGRIDITFDALLTEPLERTLEAAPGFAFTSAKFGADKVVLEYRCEKAFRPEEYPEGIPVGWIEWKCTGRGRTCYGVGGGMSPDIPIWQACYEQKQRRENLKRVCVNIIYRPRHRQDRRTGTAMVRRALATISGMIYFCCPWLTYCWNMHELTGAEYLQLINMWNNILPWGSDDLADLVDSGIGRKDNCINLYVFPIRQSNLNGMSIIGPPGTMVIDPNKFNADGTIAAHEFGHAFGLRHRKDRYSVMSPASPHGRNLNPTECKTIGQTLPSYPCSH